MCTTVWVFCREDLLITKHEITTNLPHTTVTNCVIMHCYEQTAWKLTTDLIQVGFKTKSFLAAVTKLSRSTDKTICHVSRCVKLFYSRFPKGKGYCL